MAGMECESAQPLIDAQPMITFQVGPDFISRLGIPAHMIEESKTSYSSIQLDWRMMSRDEQQWVLAEYNRRSRR
jgi:hypothetical protein